MDNRIISLEVSIITARREQDRLSRDARLLHEAAAELRKRADVLSLQAMEIAARVAHQGSVVASLHGELARLRAERGEG